MATAQKQRSFQGPAILSGGFRPFFLLAGIWAALVMALWLAVLTGRLVLPSAFDQVAWHAHELIFGYGSAVVCGFLLTAVPNWTGRLPVTGAPLGALACVWIAGRVAVAFGASMPGLAAVIDLGFLTALAAIIAREIVAAGNRRNLPVLVIVLALLVGNAAFHYAARVGGAASTETGIRLGVAALVTLISLIGGRIVPSFTSNWLAKQGPGPLPVPMGRFDVGVLGATVVSLALWLAWPENQIVGGLFLATAVLQLLRLRRWVFWRTLSEPLVWVLHLGYLFISIGFALAGCGILWPDTLPAAASLHGWLTGAVGLMTLAVMTRASLGHSGRELTAGPAEVAIYLAILTAASARVAAGFGGPDWLLHLAATAWIGGFGLFALRYWPILTRARTAAKKPSRAA
ncbi:MAG: NnrS family protein [Rhodobacteraceae bacterium]|nr:NnrS family protein [Paracoccaceae bacterium]